MTGRPRGRGRRCGRSRRRGARSPSSGSTRPSVSAAASRATRTAPTSTGETSTGCPAARLARIRSLSSRNRLQARSTSCEHVRGQVGGGLRRHPGWCAARRRCRGRATTRRPPPGRPSGRRSRARCTIVLTSRCSRAAAAAGVPGGSWQLRGDELPPELPDRRAAAATDPRAAGRRCPHERGRADDRLLLAVLGHDDRVVLRPLHEGLVVGLGRRGVGCGLLGGLDRVAPGGLLRPRRPWRRRCRRRWRRRASRSAR